jgi:hypothetical protein
MLYGIDLTKIYKSIITMNAVFGSQEPGRIAMDATQAAWIIVQVARREPWIARTVKNPILRKQCRLVGRNLRGVSEWQRAMQPLLVRLVKVLAEQTRIWEEVPVWRHPIVPILVRMCAYEANWIRAPEEWLAPRQTDVKTIMRSLLAHVFVRFPVADFLYHAWQVRGDLRWRERDWFVQLAQGASWRDLQGLPRTVSRRALHECAQAPEDLSIAQGLRWGQVLASGGGRHLAREVVISRMAHDMTHDAWWSRLIQKFAAAGEKYARVYGLVADLFVEMFHQEQQEKVDRLLALPVKELTAHAWKYWRDAAAALSLHLPEWQKRSVTHRECRLQLSSMMRQCWHPMIPNSLQRSYPVRMGVISLRELTSAAELIAEGREMRHCVARHSVLCLRKERSIFSLIIHRADEEERLTVEVCRETRKVTEIKGRWNRQPSAHAWTCLEQWTYENGCFVA